MEFKVVATKLTDDLGNDLLADVIGRLVRDGANKREEQIIEVLKNNGHTFETKEELYEFAKTRCEVIAFDYNQRKILKVDGKPVCEWCDTPTFNNDGNTYKVTWGKITYL